MTMRHPIIQSRQRQRDRDHATYLNEQFPMVLEGIAKSADRTRNMVFALAIAAAFALTIGSFSQIGYADQVYQIQSLKIGIGAYEKLQKHPKAVLTKAETNAEAAWGITSSEGLSHAYSELDKISDSHSIVGNVTIPSLGTQVNNLDLLGWLGLPSVAFLAILIANLKRQQSCIAQAQAMQQLDSNQKQMIVNCHTMIQPDRPDLNWCLLVVVWIAILALPAEAIFNSWLIGKVIGDFKGNYPKLTSAGHFALMIGGELDAFAIVMALYSCYLVVELYRQLRRLNA